MEPLTRRDWLAFLALSLAVAATRFLAVAKSLWDWDEALFALAVQHYNVTAYHPQPPGFPVFIAAAKLLPFDDPFRALQFVTVAASLFVFPAMFFLAREAGAPKPVAYAAALLLAFTPNVWFYGGTALSDVPSLVLTITACALILRGRRSAGSLLLGGLVLGIAAGIRPQSLLIAAAPLVMAFLSRRKWTIVAVLIAGVIVAASYGTAAHLSGGWDVYRETLERHETYIRQTDSFLASSRPSLLRVADDFFVRPYRALPINIAITLLVLLGLVRRQKHVLLMLATFGPFCLFAWLYLDYHSASRFSVAYIPLFAFLAANGIDTIARRFPRAAAAALAVVITMMIAWTVPALHTVRTTSSPPVAAMRWIDEREDPRTTIVCFDDRLGPHAALLLARFERCAASSLPPALWASRARLLFVREGDGAVTFTRPPTRLVRDRYFITSVLEANRIVFGEGWREEEGSITQPYRWLDARSVIILPPAKRARLLLILRGNTASVYLNGKLLTRDLDWSGEVEGSERSELVIETRDGGPMRLDRLEWSPLP